MGNTVVVDKGYSREEEEVVSLAGLNTQAKYRIVLKVKRNADVSDESKLTFNLRVEFQEKPK